MPNKSEKNSLKSDLFWTRFEKSGSIQAYLRFRQARQGEAQAPLSRKAEVAKPAAKRSGSKSEARTR
jgi:hypothetical protein